MHTLDSELEAEGLTEEDLEIVPWDAARHLRNQEAIAGYMRECLATGSLPVITKALGDISRSVGMTKIAEKTGISRQSLYQSLSGATAPRLDTVLKVLDALNLRLSAESKV